jgi:uncharacterized protein (TIGR03492 family)
VTPSSILFVTNGHGESSIAERIAEEVGAVDARIALDHFPLVGTGLDGRVLREVGPRRAMPSGGLVAMGNVRAFASDIRAGFASLFAAQLRFLGSARGDYAAVAAIGDAYALFMALVARAATVFVGTAKSAYVAPYGPFERVLLRRARRVFVRDEPTAADLRAKGVAAATSPGNVIVDLLRAAPAAFAGEWIGLLPGSRSHAYDDAVRLARVVRALGNRNPGVQAALSVAPGLDPRGFAARLEADGWLVADAVEPAVFSAAAPGAKLVGYGGELGALLRSCTLVLGQAGTANEAAAACGIPVLALEGDAELGSGWYRMRQRRLLGDALEILPADPAAAADALRALLADAGRLAHMSATGLERMGDIGGARRIATETVALARAQAAA